MIGFSAKFSHTALGAVCLFSALNTFIPISFSAETIPFVYSADEWKIQNCLSTEKNVSTGQKKFTFYLKGRLPEQSLTKFYSVLAEKSPPSLKPLCASPTSADVTLPVNRNERLFLINSIGQTVNSIPKIKIGPIYNNLGQFNDISRKVFKPQINSQSIAVVPKLFPRRIPTRARINLTKEQVSSKSALDTICKNYGKEEKCIVPNKLYMKSGPELGAITFLDHYALAVDIHLPDKKDKNALELADEIIDAISAGLKINQNNAQWAPSYSLENTANRKSEANPSPASVTPPPIYTSRDQLNKTAGLIHENFSDHNTNIYVVEEWTPANNEIISLEKMEHPFFDTRATPSIHDDIRIVDMTSNSANEPKGHAFHVSGIIGGQTPFNELSGLAKEQETYLLNMGYFNHLYLTHLEERPLEHAQGNRAELPSMVYNLSWDLELETPMGNNAFQKNTANIRSKDRIKDRVRELGKFSTKDIFVVAANTGDTNYKDDECPDFPACLGEWSNVITVLPLQEDGTTVEHFKYKLSPDFLMVAAPGTKILSSDSLYDEDIFGIRTGSSQAAAITTALAAKIFAKDKNLTGFDVKSRIFAGVTLLDDIKNVPPRYKKQMGLSQLTKLNTL